VAIYRVVASWPHSLAVAVWKILACSCRDKRYSIWNLPRMRSIRKSHHTMPRLWLLYGYQNLARWLCMSKRKVGRWTNARV